MIDKNQNEGDVQVVHMTRSELTTLFPRHVKVVDDCLELDIYWLSIHLVMLLHVTGKTKEELFEQINLAVDNCVEMDTVRNKLQ